MTSRFDQLRINNIKNFLSGRISGGTIMEPEEIEPIVNKGLELVENHIKKYGVKAVNKENLAELEGEFNKIHGITTNSFPGGSEKFRNDAIGVIKDLNMLARNQTQERSF